MTERVEEPHDFGYYNELQAQRGFPRAYKAVVEEAMDLRAALAQAERERERLKADLQWSEQARGECLLLIDQLKIRPSPGSLWQQAEADLARVRAALEKIATGADNHWCRAEARAALEGRG